MAVKPAAGPETLVCEPLRRATTRPPMTPLRMPDIIGAFEANAIPRQRGRATKNTTSPEDRSLENVLGDKFTFMYLSNGYNCTPRRSLECDHAHARIRFSTKTDPRRKIKIEQCDSSKKRALNRRFEI